MAIDLSFSITQENRNGEVFFIINVTEKGSSRIVYLSDLKQFAREEKDLAALLIEERSVECGIASRSAQAETLSCNKIRVRSSSCLNLMQKLIASKKFLWKERSLFFNPLSKSKVKLEAEVISQDALMLSGVLQIDGISYPSSAVDFLFKGSPVFGICKQVLFVLPKQTKISWLLGFYPESKILEGKEKDRFIEDYKEDPPEGFPEISWKGDFSSPAEIPLIKAPLAVFPVLILKDLHGAFVDLKMEYKDRTVDFLDLKSFPGRNIQVEKAWEKDLLETDFIRKNLGTSSYYCPMDKVSKSLSFILEMGWKVLDSKNRALIKLTKTSILISSQNTEVLVKGSFHYEDHKASLSDVIGAFNRREKFLELSSNAIGWLDGSSGYEGLDDLSLTEMVGEGCLLKKKQFGLLESFIKRPDAHFEENAQSLLDRLKTAELIEEEVDPFFQGQLHPYQIEGKQWLSFLYHNGLSGLLADEMGLGKTIQTLSFLSAAAFSKPVLIVVPTSLVFNWKKEWETFLPHKKLYIHEGPTREGAAFLQKEHAILTSYAYLRIDHALFSKLDLSYVILDEAQWIKNPESQLAKAAFGLQADTRLCLSGTPIENRADDLWSLFHFLEPELLGERKSFVKMLEASEVDDRRLQRIRKTVKPFILRRMKEDVAKDLPEKIEQVVWVDMKEGQRAFYEEWLFKTRQGLLKKVKLDGAGAHRMEVFEAILRLRQICCHPSLVDGERSFTLDEPSAKLEKVCVDLEEALGQKRKVLVYSQFTQMLKILEKEIKQRGWKYVYLDGETKDREAVVSSFQEDPSVMIFLISLKAGGVGLNLTAADYVFLFDPWWNGAVERQAIDRAHRFGQKNTVVARRYVVAMSIEEKMMKLKEHKFSLAEGLLDFETGDSGLLLNDMIDLLN